jgi:acetylornithine deacetylase
MTEQLHIPAVNLLKRMISIPSFSKEEAATANIIAVFLNEKGITTNRLGNNVWACNKFFDKKKPTLLLNSHHDTVKPNKDYTRDPFQPLEADGKLYGLGSNDAGGCLVSLLSAFVHYYDKADLKYNLIFCGSAEEEISGTSGVASVLGKFAVDCAIVGEPTLMNMAVAEKGLLVIDCTVTGRSGHAAREEGDNAIYKTLADIEWFRTFQFPKTSPLLGPVKMSVTIIEAGTQHNVVPAECNFVVDIRINELYTHEEVLEIIKQHVQCTVLPRSLRLRSSAISLAHPLVAAGMQMGKTYYGSPTLSDKSLMPFPALKMGPGDSARSHMADEFIYVQEIHDGIDTYIQLLDGVL